MNNFQFRQKTAVRLAITPRIVRTPWTIKTLILMVLGLEAVLAIVSSSTSAQPVFSNLGRWTIFRGKAACFALTRVGSNSLAFGLVPKPKIVLTGSSWDIPAGNYPLGMEFGGSAYMVRKSTVPSVVLPDQGNHVIVQFSTAQDLVEVMSEGWVSFALGGHQEMFNTDASDAIRMLSVCKTQIGSDPFASVH